MDTVLELPNVRSELALEEFWKMQKDTLPMLYKEVHRILTEQLHSMQTESSSRYLKRVRDDQQISMTDEQEALCSSYPWNGVL